MSKYVINNETDEQAKITKKQHIIPRASIERFYTDANNVYVLRENRLFSANAENPIFCCSDRSWDQCSEENRGKKIEDDYQCLANSLIDKCHNENIIFNNDNAKIINEFTALWFARSWIEKRTGGSWVTITSSEISQQDKLDIKNKLSIIFQKNSVDTFSLHCLDKNKRLCKKQISNDDHQQQIEMYYKKYSNRKIMDKEACDTLITLARQYVTVDINTEDTPLPDVSPAINQWSQEERQRLERAGCYTLNDDGSTPGVFMKSPELWTKFNSIVFQLRKLKLTWKIFISEKDLICPDTPVTSNLDELQENEIKLFFPIAPKILLGATTYSDAHIGVYRLLYPENLNKLSFQSSFSYCFSKEKSTLS